MNCLYMSIWQYIPCLANGIKTIHPWGLIKKKSSVWSTISYCRYLKKTGGYNEQNLMTITTKTRTLIWVNWCIIIFHLTNSNIQSYMNQCANTNVGFPPPPRYICKPLLSFPWIFTLSNQAHCFRNIVHTNKCSTVLLII